MNCQNIKCDVSNCVHNNAYNCVLDSVVIESMTSSVKDSEDTICSSFKAK